MALAAPAFGAPAVTAEFPLPAGETVGANNEITQGPDGNMWVTSENNSVVRIQPDGSMQAFPTTNTPFGIAVGPDNFLWVSTTLGVAKIDPATGTETNFPLGGTFANGRGITAGPDGNMWVSGDGELVRFATGDPVVSQDVTAIAGLSPRGMTTGSDGLIWIADAGNGQVISATATDTPTLTSYDVKIGGQGQPQDVGAGPNGQVAYANPVSTPQSVGRITPGGSPLFTELENSDPFGVAFGQDQAYWIARSATNDLLRLTPDGAATTLTGFQPSGGVGPRKVATGPNGTLWVTLDTPDKIGLVTGVEAPVTNPETKIDKGPSKKVKTKKAKAKVKFRFSSPNAGATFECALKKKGKKLKFKACESPRKYMLKPGKYAFQVRAAVGGVVDATPAKKKFKVVAA
jgi:streptogramin lyase